MMGLYCFISGSRKLYYLRDYKTWGENDQKPADKQLCIAEARTLLNTRKTKLIRNSSQVPA